MRSFEFVTNEIHAEGNTRALVVKENGESLAVFGLQKVGTRQVLFLRKLKPVDLNRYKRDVIKGYRQIMDIAKRSSLPVVARADPEIDGSDRLLVHMGFDRLYGRVYQCRIR